MSECLNGLQQFPDFQQCGQDLVAMDYQPLRSTYIEYNNNNNKFVNKKIRRTNNCK